MSPSNLSVITVPKDSYSHFPILLALLITCGVHFLLIVGISLIFPQNSQQINTIAVTLIKTKPLAQLPHKEVMIPRVTHKKAVEIPTAKTAPHNTDTASQSEPKKQQTPKISAPQIKKVEKSAVVVKKTAIEPIVSANSVEPVLPSPENITVTPVTPVIVEPTPIAKVTQSTVDTVVSPIISKSPELEKSIPAVDSIPPENSDKAVELPTKTTQKSGKKVTKKNSRKAVASTETIQPVISMDDLAAQIAQVGEKFGNQAPSDSDSRIKSLNSVREHKASARQYKQDWRAKIERIANLNFPEAARQKDFSARLVLEVGINADGSIYSLKIKKSSGTPALDEAAKNIVQMSAPFAALPKDLNKELDVLVLQQPMQFSDESGATAQ